jgi:DNA-binding transcriptional ArsR family regulator
MSRRSRNGGAAKRRLSGLANPAVVFAVLGDATRMALVMKLCGRCPYSISQLTRGSKLTRQAITKHLRVLVFVEE